MDKANTNTKTDPSKETKASKNYHTINRRRFLTKASGTIAAFTIVPRHVIGGSKHVPPSEKINIGYIGAGTQGIRQLIKALPNPEIKIISVCDPNKDSADYIPWSKNEIRNKVRAFLKNPNWGSGIDGCRCGRQPVRKIIDSYYAMDNNSAGYKACSTYSDFRDLLENENDLDAVYIMTPDHLHATIAIAAMKKGKHVIQHKPLSNILYEARLAADTARTTGLATHMFCSADKETTPLLCEWIWNGAIGNVTEVHNWSSRPFWPQGMTEIPAEQQPVPKGLDWDLWLGPVPHRPYNKAYTHTVFRGWYDFGAGSLGDMGNYSFYQIFKILKLTSPIAVEANRSQYWAIVDNLWKMQQNKVSFPRASTIHFKFPARQDMPPLSLYWYDGGLRPPKPPELETDGKDMPREGLLFVGDKGKILAGFSGDNPRLIPQSRMNAFKKPPEKLPRPIDEFAQWLRACKGGRPSGASFENVYPFAETVCLGSIALRVNKQLKWNTKKMKFTNSKQANELLHRKYRQGWQL